MQERNHFINSTKHSEAQEATARMHELKPEKSWNGSVSIQNLTQEEFIQTVTQLATELDFIFYGYILKKDNGFNYHFGSYPRQILPIEKYLEALKKLAEKLSVEGVVEKKSKKPRFRILLGLQEGYAEQEKLNIIRRIDAGEITDLEEAKKIIREKIKNLSDFPINLDDFLELRELRNVLTQINFGREHSLKEVQSALGEEFDFASVEICTIGSNGKYMEPAVVIEGDKSQVQKIYTLAINFHQARIAVEDLQYHKSHILETEFCENSDTKDEKGKDPIFY